MPLRTIVVPPPPDASRAPAREDLLRRRGGTAPARPDRDAVEDARRSHDAHPVRPMLAVALPDDSIRFVPYRTDAEVRYQGLALTHEFQRECHSVAWSPLSEVVAVGTRHGVCLWRLFPDESSWMTFLQHPRRKGAGRSDPPPPPLTLSLSPHRLLAHYPSGPRLDMVPIRQAFGGHFARRSVRASVGRGGALSVPAALFRPPAGQPEGGELVAGRPLPTRDVPGATPCIGGGCLAAASRL